MSAADLLVEQNNPSKRYRRIAILVIILATLLGGALRFYDLGEGGVWYDELYTVRDVSPENTGYSPTRWLGYQPTKLLLAVQGVSPSEIPGDSYWLYQSLGITMDKARLASCLLGFLTIPLFAWVACRPFGPAVAALIALIVAFSVWNVSWSQVARFYTQVGLLGGLSVLLYIDAIQSGSRWRFAASICLVVLAYLTHPPAITIGGAFVVDGLVQMIRRRNTNYGWWGWLWASAGMLVCISILLYEHANDQRGYSTFVGEQADGRHGVAEVFVYLFIMLTPALVLAALVGLFMGRRHRAVWVLAFAAMVPVIVICAVSLSGGFSHYRYSYVSMIGWVGLAAVGGYYMARALRERVGTVLAWSPAAIVFAAMMSQLGSYLTTGNRFTEPFHLAWEKVAPLIDDEDAVFSERFELGQYYLEREDVYNLPGSLNRIDEQAKGKQAWLVRLSTSSSGRRVWRLASDERMRLVDRMVNAVWLPYLEVSVYRLEPAEDREVQPDSEVQP